MLRESQLKLPKQFKDTHLYSYVMRGTVRKNVFSRTRQSVTLLGLKPRGFSLESVNTHKETRYGSLSPKSKPYNNKTQ